MSTAECHEQVVGERWDARADLALRDAPATIEKRLRDMLSTLYSARRDCILLGFSRAAFEGLCLLGTRSHRTYCTWFQGSAQFVISREARAGR